MMSKLKGVYLEPFDHRAAAAFWAIALRSLGVNLSARALPPMSPPKRPNATAAGFFSGFSVGSFSVSAIVSSIKDFASSFSSLLERFITPNQGILP
jgi:hypothetical protein